MSSFVFKPEEWLNQHCDKRLSTSVQQKLDVYKLFGLEINDLIDHFRQLCPYSIYIHSTGWQMMEIRQWSVENIKGYWYSHGLFEMEYMFENEDEATLFKLTWGGR